MSRRRRSGEFQEHCANDWRAKTDEAIKDSDWHVKLLHELDKRHPYRVGRILADLKWLDKMARKHGHPEGW